MENNKNNQIKDNVKLKISISEFEKEGKIEMKKTNKSILKVASIACLLLVSVTGVVFAKDIGTFIQNLFGANTSQGVNTAVENGYETDIKTSYQNADGIQVSVDSLTMDDFNFAMNFKVSLDEKYNIDEFEHSELYDLKIVDETGKLVFNSQGAKFDSEEIMKEQSYKGAYSFLPEMVNENEFKLSLSATGNPEVFPKSKHLTITFSKIVTRSMNYEDDTRTQNFYEGNWNFEVDVPEQFYNRQTTTYKVIKCSDEKTNVTKAILADTGFKISLTTTTDKVDYELLNSQSPENISDMIALQKEYVETSDGKRFETAQRSDGDGGYSVSQDKVIDYYQTFNLTKYDATDNIKVHIFTNKGEEIIIEMQKQ